MVDKTRRRLVGILVACLAWAAILVAWIVGCIDRAARRSYGREERDGLDDKERIRYQTWEVAHRSILWDLDGLTWEHDDERMVMNLQVSGARWAESGLVLSQEEINTVLATMDMNELHDRVKEIVWPCSPNRD